MWITYLLSYYIVLYIWFINQLIKLKNYQL